MGHQADRRALPASLVVMLVLNAAIRVPGAAEPLERDITNYAVVAHQMLAGKTLYSEVWDHKPPGIYLTFAAAELLLGYGQPAITLLGILASTATLLFLFSLIRSGAGARSALLGAALWALASNSARLEANQPNVEVFLNVAIAAALWVLSSKRGTVRRRCASAGIILAVASLFKTVAVFPLLSLAASRLAKAPAGSSVRGHVRQRAGDAAALLLPVGMVWAIAFAAFALLGILREAWDAIVTFNGFYAGNIPGNLGRLLATPRLLFHPALLDIVPLLLLAIAGLAVPLEPGVRQSRQLAGAVLAGCVVMLAAPGKFFPHYYQVVLPPACVLAACALSGPSRAAPFLGPKRGARAASIAAAISIAWLAIVQVWQLAIGPVRVSELKYGPQFVDTRAAATAVARLSLPEEPILVWGSDSGIYFYSRRSPAVSLTHIYPLVIGPRPYRQRRIEATLDEIARARPPLIVYSDESGPVQTSSLYPIIQARYVPIERSKRFTIYLNLDALRRCGQDSPAPLGRRVVEIRGPDLTTPTIVETQHIVAVGTGVHVRRGKALHVRSGRLVMVRNGFSVGSGASLALGVDPTLLAK